MKIVNESIFLSALRSFFISLTGALGALIGLGLVVFLFIGLLSSSDDKKGFSSGVKILPNAEGSRKELPSSTPVLLHISIDGEIGKDPITAEKIETILLDSREDEFKNGRVKGILLSINSPGGSANETNIIYHHLKTYKKRYNVPIYAYVDGMCASGGYYIACAADKIYTSEVSLIGSVGVLAWPPYFNIHDAMEKLGVSAKTLSAGIGKDEMNPTRAWKPNEGEDRQKIIDFYYTNFVEVVSQNRPGVTVEDLEKVYGANVFPAPIAQEHGMVDQVGVRHSDALMALAEASDVSESYQVVCFKTRSWWKELFKEKLHTSPLLTGRVTHTLPEADVNRPFSYLYVP